MKRGRVDPIFHKKLRVTMYQLLLIERYLPNSFFWPNLVRQKRLDNLSVEEVLRKYKGFESEPVFHFLLDNEGSETALMDSQIAEGIKTCLEIKKKHDCIMLHILSGKHITSKILETQSTAVGFDVGVCNKESTLYSSIFNEILFGNLDELIFFKKYLNEHLLFSEHALAQKYLDLHNELSAQGRDVEDYEEMEIYEVRIQIE